MILLKLVGQREVVGLDYWITFEPESAELVTQVQGQLFQQDFVLLININSIEDLD